MSRLIKISFYSLAILLLCIITSLTFLFYSASGLQLSLWALKHWGPENLQYQSITGRLGGRPLIINQLDFENDQVTLSVKKAQLRLNPWALLIGRISIAELHMEKLHTQIHTQSQWFNVQKPKPAKPSSASLPLSINITQATLNDVQVDYDDTYHLSSDNMAFHIQAYGLLGRNYFNGKLDWQNLTIKRLDTTILHSPTGQNVIRSSNQGYVFEHHSKLEWFDQQTIGLTVSGSGSTSHFKLTTFAFTPAKGQLTGSGELNWHQGLRWNLALLAKNMSFQPGQSKQNFNFNLKTHGVLSDKKRQVHFHMGDVSGYWQQKLLSGGIQTDITDHDFAIQHMNLNLGPIKLYAQGGQQQKWDLKWHFQIPELKIISNALKGAINFSGSVLGNRNHPEIKVNLSASQLGYGAFSLKNLSSNLRLQTTKLGPTQWQFMAQDLRWGPYYVPQIKLSTQGQSQQNTTRLSVTTPQGTSKATFVGQYKNQSWQGQLKDIHIHSSVFNNWQLSQAPELFFSANKIRITPFCLRSQQQKLCMSAHYQHSQHWQLTLKLERFAYNSIIQYILSRTGGEDVSANGHLDLNVQLKNDVKGLQGQLRLKVHPGSVSFLDENQQKRRIHFSGGGVSGTIANNKLVLNSNIHLANGQFIRGQLQVPHLNQPTHLQTLRGNLHLYYRNFALLSQLYPNIRQARGQLNVNVTVQGTVKNPQFAGKAQLTQGQFFLPNLNIHPKAINITATGTPTGFFTVSGSARSGKGNLQINGKMFMNRRGFPATLSIRGSNLEVINTDEYQIIVNPQLEMQKRARHIRFTGNIQVVDALIQARNFRRESATLPDDVIFITDKKQSVQRFQVTGQVNLNLGSNFKLNVRGLSGQVTGHLQINYQRRGLTTAIGTLTLKNGVFDAYGRQLDVTQGRLIYTGGALANPNLDISASKTIPIRPSAQVAAIRNNFISNGFITGNQVTVGINIKGSLRRHQVSLFSNPAMYSQADILTLLLTGSTANNLASNQAQLLLQGASSLGLGGLSLGNITQELQRSFGLDELGIQQTTVGINSDTPSQTTSFVVGKYITPRLFVSYSLGLLDSLSILRVRYQINDNWSIQTDASVRESGGDIFYSIEK